MEPLKPGLPKEELRQALPKQSASGLSEAILKTLVAEGSIKLNRGLIALANFVPELDERQSAVQAKIRTALGSAGLSVPGLQEISDGVQARVEEVEAILKLMEGQGEVLGLEGSMFFLREAIEKAGFDLVNSLGGKGELGPADFREVLGVSRKFLLPILRYFDVVGVTTRVGENRTVGESLPEGWGTFEEERF
jgi:selenocysteine-specific elongation factor